MSNPTGTELEILRLSECDPTKDVVIFYVDVGKMPPQRVKGYLEDFKAQMADVIHPAFKVIYIPRRPTGESVTGGCAVQIEKEDNHDYEHAMKVL